MRTLARVLGGPKVGAEPDVLTICRSTRSSRRKARVFAHLSEPFPQRYFDDHAELQSIIGDQMAEDLFRAIELDILTGDGTGQHFTGLEHTSGVRAQAFTSDVLRTLRKARTTMSTTGEVPTAWDLNHDDLEAIDLLREDNDGTDTGGFLTSVEDKVFGNLPRIGSGIVPAGVAWRGDWAQLALRIREDGHLDADTSGDNFTHNTTRLRFRGRFGLLGATPRRVHPRRPDRLTLRSVSASTSPSASLTVCPTSGGTRPRDRRPPSGSPLLLSGSWRVCAEAERSLTRAPCWDLSSCEAVKIARVSRRLLSACSDRQQWKVGIVAPLVVSDVAAVEVALTRGVRALDLGSLTQILGKIKSSLEGIDRLTRESVTVGAAVPRIVWTVDSVGERASNVGSDMYLRLAPSAAYGRPEASWSSPGELFVSGLNSLIERPEIPPLFDYGTMNRVSRIGAHVESGELKQIRVSSLNGRRVDAVVDERSSTNAKIALSPSVAAVSSIVGIVDRLDGGKSKRVTRAQIFDPLTRRSVRVKASGQVEAALVALFGETVVAEGLLERNAVGQPVLLHLKDVRLHQVEPLQPISVQEMIGAVPGATGNWSTNDFMKLVRGA